MHTLFSIFFYISLSLSLPPSHAIAQTPKPYTPSHDIVIPILHHLTLKQPLSPPPLPLKLPPSAPLVERKRQASPAEA